MHVDKVIQILQELPDRIVVLTHPMDMEWDHKEALKIGIENTRQLEAIRELLDEYKDNPNGFMYQVGRVFDGDYVLKEGRYGLDTKEHTNGTTS